MSDFFVELYEGVNACFSCDADTSCFTCDADTSCFTDAETCYSLDDCYTFCDYYDTSCYTCDCYSCDAGCM